MKDLSQEQRLEGMRAIVGLDRGVDCCFCNERIYGRMAVANMQPAHPECWWSYQFERLNQRLQRRG